MNALPRFWILALIVACLGMTRGTRGDQQETQIDTHEGSTVRLQCRFPPINNPNSRTTSPPFFWWLAHTNNFHDNAAINNSPLGLQYRVNLDLEKGIYDLEIHNVSYARDNGKYECRVKQGDTGDSLYHKNITLTVLRAPGPPTISPVSAIAKEGEKLELSCNSFGGSPEPEVRWYRGSSNQPIHSGKTYVIIPSKEDDRDELRCVVRNRAMPPGQTLSASVTLDVHYYPRVTVNTDTLRVEVNSIATLRCRVDSKPAVGSVRWIRDGRFVATSFNHTLSKISLQDAGKYTCMADNGLPKKGEASVFLNVLYPPQVFIEGERLRTAEVGDNIVVRCNVTANPPPDSIEWLRDGKPEFRVTDPTLRLSRVTAEHAGNYTCRAINSIHPTGAERSKNHSASSRVEIRVRHKPGPARITPDSPVAVEGSKVILTCIANPPGYPEAQFKWYKEGEVYRRPNGNEHMDSKLEINSVNLNSEGTYQCRAFNEIGDGEETKVNLTVNLAPKILSKLQPHVTRKVGESSFQVSCVAQGKPRPTVRWLKDDRELTADQSRYKVTTIPSDGRVVTVNSTLSFLGNARPETDRIIADDRGKYTCVVENEVKHVESQMMLKVEHAPIPLNVYDKVANNKGETASVTCKVQAWPKPEFQWSFGANQATLQGSSSDGHYEISTTSDNYDVHTSVLKITNIRDNDYGDYSCRALNTQGFITSAITLQAKGAPERPINVRAMDVGPTHVVLIWDLGFDGGLPVSKYFISYKKVAGGDDIIAPDCAPSQSTPSGQWQEIECRQFNPCNVSNLEQHQSYAFKVKVYNPAGHSDYSEEVTATTAVAKIPSPAGVRYDPDGNTLGISVGPTCLALVAFIEKSDSGSSNTWRQVDNWPLDVLGGQSTQREGVLEDPHASSSEPRIRVRLCLKADSARCGEYVEAELGPSFIAHAGALGTPTLIAIVVSSAVFLLFGALLLLFCRCFRRKHAAKAKDYEMDSNAVRPSLVTGNGQQTQAPPPYYAENKALEHSLDHALAMEDSKSPAYGQTGYGYHQPNHNINGVNMGYMENSYSNSNNGGSVNSQDSIWQMKTAAANGVGVNAGNVGVVGTPYDMGGYGITEPDYSCQPQYMPQHTADYRDSHNLSRQQFIEPYPPATLKAQKHMDSPYDVSGLPYQETYDEEVKPPQQVSLSYDESLESGYSTPNSRGRRIIREIIV